MKRYFYQLILTFVTVLFLITATAHAAATLPNTAVWFTPINATAGSPIALNALVYNNQDSTATVTLEFTTPSIKIATVVTAIPANTAKTISFNWTAPATSTTVTATVTSAVNAKKQILTPLLGTIGTTTVGSSPLITTTTLDGLSLPTKVIAWVGPFLTSVENFRIKEAAQFAAQRDAVKKIVSSSTSGAFGNPLNYANLIYSTCAATVFANQALFYIAGILIILLLLRFIVNLIF